MLCHSLIEWIHLHKVAMISCHRVFCTSQPFILREAIEQGLRDVPTQPILLSSMINSERHAGVSISLTWRYIGKYMQFFFFFQ